MHFYGVGSIFEVVGVFDSLMGQFAFLADLGATTPLTDVLTVTIVLIDHLKQPDSLI